MLDKNAAVKRIKALIEHGIPFSPTRKKGRALTHAEGGATSVWVTSVIRVVPLIDPSPDGYYQSKCQDISARFAVAHTDRARSNSIRSECVGELVSILQGLLAEIEAGRIASETGTATALPEGDMAAGPSPGKE